MSQNPSEFDRRKFLSVGAPVLTGAMVASTAVRVMAEDQEPTAPRVLRIAHFCDVHVQPEKRAAEGLARALADAQERFSPDLILNGGDQVMDVMGCRPRSGDRVVHPLAVSDEAGLLRSPGQCDREP